MQGNDFFEGVRANLIDKDKNPQWKYKNVFEVPDEEVPRYFETDAGPDLDVAAEYAKLLS